MRILDPVCYPYIVIIFIIFLISNVIKTNGNGRNSRKRRRTKRKRAKPKAKHFDLLGRPLYYIYVLKDGNKIFYVGQTVDPVRRESEHRNSGKWRGTAKERYIYRMNKPPNLVVVETCVGQEAANKAERRWIRRHGKTNTLLK